MNRLRMLLGALAVALLVSGTLFGDDKKDPPKGKGTLPAHFKSLGLSDEQTTKIKAVHAEYKEKIDGLKQQIKDAEKEERSKYDKILSDDQKKRLKELLAEKVIGSETDKDKKDPDKKEK
jgi:hypothetical protein